MTLWRKKAVLLRGFPHSLRHTSHLSPFCWVRAWRFSFSWWIKRLYTPRAAGYDLWPPWPLWRPLQNYVTIAFGLFVAIGDCRWSTQERVPLSLECILHSLSPASTTSLLWETSCWRTNGRETNTANEYNKFSLTLHLTEDANTI